MENAAQRADGLCMPAPVSPARTLRIAVALAVLVGVLGALVPAAAATGEPAPAQGWVSGPGLTFLTAGRTVPEGWVEAPDDGGVEDGQDESASAIAGSEAAPTSAGAFVPPANDDFVLDFAGSVDAGTRQVVQTAAGIWSQVLDVRVPIVVDVSMEALDTGILGGTKPVEAHFGQPAFPQPDVLYPLALANQFVGRDLRTSLPDIEMVLSSTMNWDRSTDGSVASTAQSMLSVAVHEMGHGLGHTSWVRQTDLGWAVNYVANGATVAFAYDRLVTTPTGAAITSLPESALASVLTTPLSWAGSRGRTANGGTSPRLYSPLVFETGSSVGHLDEATFTSEVMTPFLRRGEVHTTIPPITKAMLTDIGWTFSAPSSTSTSTTTPTTTTTSTTPTTVAPTGGTPTGPLTSSQRTGAFVTAVTTDFLGRRPTAAEVTRWRDHLLSGGSREVVTRHFAFSDEWIGVIVDGLYRSTLGRAADADGRAHWVQVIRSGRTPAEVAAWFYASDEYFARAGGTASGWVQDLYREVLGRPAEADGLAFWVDRARWAPRSSIAFDLYQSIESRRDRVDALFQRLLGRVPDAGGWAYWAGVLANGRDVDLAMFLGASDEYYGRAAVRFA